VDAVDLSEKSAGTTEKASPGETLNVKKRKPQGTHIGKKLSLADLRVGMEEIAAAKEPKDKKAELLRQMDPAEQERLIREVLKEFL
jgi:hypothetical protein